MALLTPLHTLFPSSMLATKIILTRRLKRATRLAILSQNVAEVLTRRMSAGHTKCFLPCVRYAVLTALDIVMFLRELDDRRVSVVAMEIGTVVHDD